MIATRIQDILVNARKSGWVIEPRAKELFSIAGLDVPRFLWTENLEEATDFARMIGYPVVVKVVSPKIIHKSDAGGVVVGIKGDEEIASAFHRLSHIDGFEGIIVEEMLKGIELIVGATIDSQFGPVILLGMGGTTAEIYHDVTIRMAPISDRDARSMIDNLKAHKLLEGYRGSETANMDEIAKLLVTFSRVVTEIQGEIESIDLNPVICSGMRCFVADARIMLK